MFNFDFDLSAGILRVKVTGFWTSELVSQYDAVAGFHFTDARERAGALRLLIDLSQTQVLNQELMPSLAKAGMQYSRDDDRVALVVVSSLLKLQMKRMIGGAPAQIFISDAAARMWLTAYEAVEVKAPR